MDLKGLFFDLDDTLIATRHSDVIAYDHVQKFLKNIFESHGLPLNSFTVIDFYKKSLKSTPNGVYKSTTPREIRIKLWNDALQKSLEEIPGEIFVDAFPPDLATELYDLWKKTRLEEMKLLEPVTDEVLRSLRKKHTLVLITNGSSVVQWEKIQQTGMEKYFDHVIVSGDEPYDKPHISVFEKACAMCNLQPSECAMVGDTIETDIVGANMAKLAASILIKSGENSIASETGDSVKTPTHTITSVAQLSAIVSSL